MMRNEYSLLDDIRFELTNYENSTDTETTDEEWKDVFYDLLCRVVAAVEFEKLNQTFITRGKKTDLTSDTTVKSEWVKQGYDGCMSHCKRCGARALYNNHGDIVFSYYCPVCGADMSVSADDFEYIKWASEV